MKPKPSSSKSTSKVYTAPSRSIRMAPLSVTAEERETIVKAAQFYRLPVSEYMRRKILGVTISS